MAGVLPRTSYLLTWNDMVVGEFENLTAIAFHLGISEEDGVITFMGEEVNPTYGDDWELSIAIIIDWSKCYLRKNLPSSYKVYRVLIEE